MNSRTLLNERLGMLMACGSPGSALAYHLGQTTFQPLMVRRNTATVAGLDDAERGPIPGTITNLEVEAGTGTITNLEVEAGTGTITTLEVEAGTGLIGRVRSWFRRAFARLETWSWQRQMREREAYLAQATDLADLEARMRHLDGDAFLSRARALR